MKEEAVKEHLERILNVAKISPTTEILKTLSEYISDYYQRGSDEALIKMNYCIVILMIKQGLIDPLKLEKDASFLIRQKDLLETIKHIGS